MPKKLVQSGFIFSALTLFLLSALTTHAQSLCGDFVLIEEFEGEVYEERSPIEDCENPFGADDPAPFTPLLEINGENISEGEIALVPEQEPVSIKGIIPADSDYDAGNYSVYKEQGNDLLLIFDGPINQEPNIVLESGVYTAVFQRSLTATEVTMNPSFPKRILEWFIPTAYAYIYFKPESVEAVTISFTVEFEPEITGASSILFLPGIQASRLYKTGILGTEDRVWEPNVNQDIRQLEMTSTGESVNDIYTRDVIDEAALPFLGQDIYKNFLAFLAELDNSETIENFESFAYDWRFSVDDIVVNGTKYKNELKSVIASLESLAESSYSGKVTIVGHSNGGLLAKALMVELDRLGKSDLVDDIIFIGTPHLGTPKAIGTILHGYDQQKLGGAIIDDKDAREVISNMPGAYALLPSETYLNKLAVPIISIGEWSVTTPMRLRYGTSINDLTEYSEFLNGAEGRVSVYENSSLPYVTNQNMLNGALLSHRDRLDDWTPPNNVSVHNIVGVGLKTINAIEYREVVERTNCVSNIFGQITCAPAERLLRPYAHFTQYGDETVTSLSAESVVGETYYFDLDKYNRSLLNPLTSNDHANFTEVEEIKELVGNIITEATTSVAYVSSQQPTFTGESIIVSIDSPVRGFITDGLGRRTGVVEEAGEMIILKEIPGSEYIEFGGTKYLITPKDITATTTLLGEAYGSYTLTTATLDENGTQQIETYLSDATTTPQMIAVFSFNQSTSSPLFIDINGDGTVDSKSTLNGQPIVEVVVTFESLRQEIISLGLLKSREKSLLVFVDLAEQLTKKKQHQKINRRIANEVLHVLNKLVIQYEKKRWINSKQSAVLQGAIITLQTNIKL